MHLVYVFIFLAVSCREARQLPRVAPAASPIEQPAGLESSKVAPSLPPSLDTDLPEPQVVAPEVEVVPSSPRAVVPLSLLASRVFSHMTRAPQQFAEVATDFLSSRHSHLHDFIFTQNALEARVRQIIAAAQHEIILVAPQWKGQQGGLVDAVVDGLGEASRKLGPTQKLEVKILLNGQSFSSLSSPADLLTDVNATFFARFEKRALDLRKVVVKFSTTAVYPSGYSSLRALIVDGRHALIAPVGVYGSMPPPVNWSHVLGVHVEGPAVLGLMHIVDHIWHHDGVFWKCKASCVKSLKTPKDAGRNWLYHGIQQQKWSVPVPLVPVLMLPYSSVQSKLGETTVADDVFIWSKVLQEARQSLLIQVQMLRNSSMLPSVVDAVQRGVKVQLLLAQPDPSLRDELQSQLQRRGMDLDQARRHLSMLAVRFDSLQVNPKQDFFSTQMAIVDGQMVMVMDRSFGQQLSVGSNGGVVVLMDSAAHASHLREQFWDVNWQQGRQQ
ncbi:MAG: hypothetical protein OXT67_09100 [Zetaproteobacteria bacterium]|nr:hypothetical protein [Zetaproteobacteria bacterium]